jgi:hypothetical protein
VRDLLGLALGVLAVVEVGVLMVAELLRLAVRR